jgi:hypothetical protein
MIKNKELGYVMHENHLMMIKDLNIVDRDLLNMYNVQDRL